MSSPSPDVSAPRVTAVFDTSPLVFLDVLDYIDTLPKLFEVIVPPAVSAELAVKPKQPGAKTLSREWLSVRSPSEATLMRVERELGAGAGENAAVALALDMAATVVTDDLKARRFARHLGLSIVGMLGIVMTLHRQGLASRALAEELALLERHGMWLSERLKSSLLAHATREDDSA